MNNYINTSGLNFQNSVNAFRVSEDRKRMSTLGNSSSSFSNNNNSLNFSNTSNSSNSLGSTSNSLNFGSNNLNSSITSFSNVPSLNSSITTGASEIQKAKEKMFNSSSSTSLNNRMS